jgi:type III pantothenate kinase
MAGAPGHAPERVLLVGNSRWHWAAPGEGALRCWHAPPPQARPEEGWPGLKAWARVGAVAAQLHLPAERELRLADVPLQQAPSWLGIDRALAGWAAWRRHRAGVLVADAGTALSLTRVDGAGVFRGGRISAGVALQLRALGQSTALLPSLGACSLEVSRDRWPQPTAAAMGWGCLQACAGAIAEAWADVACDGLGAEQSWALWLTGGDGPALAPLLKQRGLAFHRAPDLCLEALVALA